MKRKNRGYAVVLLLTVLMAIPLSWGTAFAVEDTQVGFSVKAVLPENQNDPNVSYFDLRMLPEQQQDLVVQVFNSSNMTIEVKVEAISASTNANGIIDYKTPGVYDETLRVPFSDIAAVQEPTTLTIAAQSSERAVIHVTMPEEEYDGVVLGGLVFTKQDVDDAQADDGEQASESDITIKNEYSYVLGVKLTETDTAVTPDFEAVEVKPEVTNYRVGITHYLRNREAAIAKDVDIDVKIYPKDKDTAIKTAHTEDVSIAPNSVIPYVALWGGTLDPGSYVSHITMSMGDREWTFDMPFTVNAKMAASINSGSVETPETIPWWAIALIILIAVLILLVSILLFLHWRKRKDMVA